MSNIPRGTFMQVMEKYTKSLKAFISAQGFGHYSKPNGGIPKTDLDQSVQTSLGKADSALQSFTESDPTVPAWAKASSKPSYTQDEVGDGSTYKRVTSTEKNTWNSKGTYSKPSGGIPKSDLASAVQTSLGKADSALQSYTETDPTVPSWAKASSKPSYTASEVGAVPNTAAGVSAAINQLTTGDSAPTDDDYYVSQYAGGGSSTTTYHRRPVSKLWDYIKSKFSLSTTGSGNAVTGVSYSNGAFTVTKGSSFAASSHTHNYAGSSSAGGAATSANKLNTNAGSATQPVYFSNGVPVATTYTLGKSVPSDAKFTDTTYSAATTSAAGLMSATDKTKLNGIATGAQVNSITGVKGNSEQSYRTGNVNLTPANIGASPESHTHNYAGSSSPGGAATSANKIKIKSARCKTPKTWAAKTWSGLTTFYGRAVWTDGTNIYYSEATTQRVLAYSTWSTKTWNGLTNFSGEYIWTDGTNIYHSNGNTHHVLSGSTWSTKTWSGLTNFYGYNIWTDGENVYCSSGTTQYVLSGSTWTAKTWNGLTSFSAGYIWTDGDNIYYSKGTDQYVLDKSTSTWSTKTWSGLTKFEAGYIWTDGENIYYSYNSTQCILSGSTWINTTWTGSKYFLGASTWTDGTNIYLSGGGSGQHFVLTEMKSVR